MTILLSQRNVSLRSIIDEMSLDEFRHHEHCSWAERRRNRNAEGRGLRLSHPSWNGETPLGRVHDHDCFGRSVVEPQHLEFTSVQRMKRVVDPYRRVVRAQGIMSYSARTFIRTSSFLAEVFRWMARVG